MGSLMLLILSPKDPAHKRPSYLFEIYFNIILPCTIKSWKWFFYLQISYRNNEGISLLSHVLCYVACQ